MHRRVACLAEALGIAASIEAYIWHFRPRAFWSVLFIALAMLLSHIARRETPEWLGFGWGEFRSALVPVALPIAACCAASFVFGKILGFAKPLGGTREAADSAAYVLWGITQQYVVNGYFVNRLTQYHGPSARNRVALETALLFAMAHVPNPFLMLVTFTGGFAAARVYMKRRSLIALGIAHGAIGFSILALVPDSVSRGLIVGPGYVNRYWR